MSSLIEWLSGSLERDRPAFWLSGASLQFTKNPAQDQNLICHGILNIYIRQEAGLRVFYY